MFVLLSLAAGLHGLPGATADHTGTVQDVGRSANETIVLGPETWKAYRFFLGSNDRIDYDLTVISGTEIDVYVVPQSGLADYESDTAFRFASYDERENFLFVQGWISAVQGTVYLIVDNVHFSGAQPTGNVTVEVKFAPGASPPFPAIVAAVCAVGVGGALAVGIGLTLRHRKRRAKEASAGVPPFVPQVPPGQPPTPPQVPWQPPPPPPDG